MRKLTTALLVVILLILNAGCIPSVWMEVLEPEPSPLPSETATPTAVPSPTPTSFDYAACESRLSRILSGWESTFYGRDELRDVYKLVTYQVDGEGLFAPEYGFAPEGLVSYQGDTQRHEQMWEFASSLIPEELLGQVDYFLVYTDGAGDSLGAVEMAEPPDSWRLAIDIQDAGDFANLSITLVHEIAHLLTLNNRQITIDPELHGLLEDEELYQVAESNCDTFFFPGGCARADSYLNDFFEQFWGSLYAEWQEINEATSMISYQNDLEELYERHPGSFVSLYAVTHPVEDLAESFLHFVFSPKPGGGSIAERKVLFFYDYAELVLLREGMMESLCTQVP